MIFCVGIGNTNMRVAAGSLTEYSQSVCPSESIGGADDFVDFVNGAFGADVWHKLCGCSISSVVPHINDFVIEAFRAQNTALPVRRINASKSRVDFSQYKSMLGDDRMACAAAAAHKYPLPIIVIDLGTATTVNIIGANGAFMGGMIAAGVRMGLRALTQMTAQLPQAQVLPQVPLIGADTQECLTSGAAYGTACMLGEYTARTAQQIGCPPTVVITGGNAPDIMPLCSFDFVHDPALLIEGMFLLYG